MDLNFDDATLAFQAEVRDFLAANKESFPTKSYDTAEGFEQHRRWDKVLFDAGLSVITWPEKYGGRDATLLQWVVYEEEYFRAGAPGRASANGTSMLAPTLFAHGTEEQLDRVLPKMASGEEIWAQAWSEPESGSDLASLRSTATKTDGGWLLNGQKIWSSRAPFGERAFGLFRSDPEAERHRGLTYFMFDLKADGITVRPIAQLGGDTGFGEIFLDDVFVPDHDVIGGVHDGWRAAMSTSSNERGMSLRSPARFLAPAERLVEQWKANPDPVFADRVADAWIKAQAYRLHTFGTVTRVAAGGELGAESSVTKVFWSDLDVALHQTALDMRGADGELADSWTDGLLFALGGPIYAGTNEIQRNIIAERLLGLPREKGPNEIRSRRTAARLRRQHRRGAGRRRSARRGAGMGRGRHRPGPQGVGTAGRPRRHRAGGAGEVRRHRGAPCRSRGRRRAARLLVCARTGHRIHRGGTGSACRRRALRRAGGR